MYSSAEQSCGDSVDAFEANYAALPIGIELIDARDAGIHRANPLNKGNFVKFSLAIAVALFANVSIAATLVPVPPGPDGLVQTVGIWKAIGCADTEDECETLTSQLGYDEMRVSGELETCKEYRYTCYAK